MTVWRCTLLCTHRENLMPYYLAWEDYVSIRKPPTVKYFGSWLGKLAPPFRNCWSTQYNFIFSSREKYFKCCKYFDMLSWATLFFYFDQARTSWSFTRVTTRFMFIDVEVLHCGCADTADCLKHAQLVRECRVQTQNKLDKEFWSVCRWGGEGHRDDPLTSGGPISLHHPWSGTITKLGENMLIWLG